ncbi:ABC transporter substrate-binding protein [Orbus mooreae]|uniref:ABC transporter substrate-binding protein n=1 Tax=Orbus mooreae TaxID=3074107 RepID=UPI00370D7A31
MKNYLKLATIAALFFTTTVYANDDIINISYVKSPLNMQMIVMKEKHLLEDNAAKEGLSIKWHEINSGAKQAQALSSGDLDFGGVMNTTSVLMANGVGSPIKIIAGVSRPRDVYAIVSPKNGITSLSELKGKTIAGPKGTVLYQTLVAALVKNNMTINDVNFLQMELPQAFSALQSGRVDAALLAANMMIKAEEEGGKVLTTASGLTSPLLVMTSTDKVIKAHPEWVELVINTHDEAAKWIEANPQQAIELAANVQGISIEDAQKLYDWSHFTQRLNQQDIKDMYSEMDFMLENDMMRNKIYVEDIILPIALENE